MTYEHYRMIFFAGAILAGLFLLAAAVLFFALKIPAVIGDLSGYTARKAIRQIRAGNETGKTGRKPASGGRVWDRPTDRLTPVWSEDELAEETGRMDAGAQTVWTEEAEKAAGPFCVESEITYLHTAETIE